MFIIRISKMFNVIMVQIFALYVIISIMKGNVDSNWEGSWLSRSIQQKIYYLVHTVWKCRFIWIQIQNRREELRNVTIVGTMLVGLVLQCGCQFITMGILSIDLIVFTKIIPLYRYWRTAEDVGRMSFVLNLRIWHLIWIFLMKRNLNSILIE